MKTTMIITPKPAPEELSEREIKHLAAIEKALQKKNIEDAIGLAACANLKEFCGQNKYVTVYADPPWQFLNRTGKIAPENKKTTRYPTMTLEWIKKLPVKDIVADDAHLYLWVPNALLQDGLDVMKEWGFTYKGNIVWEKTRKDGEPDGRGVGFYFRNVTELLLFGVKTKRKGDCFRTLGPARSQVNLIRAMKREHSRKPDEFVPLIEACSPGPYIELFARGDRPNWAMWGNQATADYEPDWNTYANHTVAPEVFVEFPEAEENK